LAPPDPAAAASCRTGELRRKKEPGEARAVAEERCDELALSPAPLRSEALDPKWSCSTGAGGGTGSDEGEPHEEAEGIPAGADGGGARRWTLTWRERWR